MVHHQASSYHKSNIIDLPVWMIVQPNAEEPHRHNVKQHNALSKSNMKAWCDAEAQKTTKIWILFLMVLDLIIQYQGGNELVKINRELKGVPAENVENDSSGG